MFTLEDFIAMVEEDMTFATISMEITEKGTELKVFYEDYKASTFHNYNVIVNKTDITLYIYVDPLDKPQYVKDVSDLKQAYELMKKHDELMWEMTNCEFREGLL